MKVNTTPKRFLSVRLTSEELEEVKQHSQTSTCRSLTEYVKKVLTKKPVTVKVRNQSQDDLLAVDDRDQKPAGSVGGGGSARE